MTSTVSLPVSSSVAQADPGQYLDSQVLLLQSQGVARRAAQLADRQPGGGRLQAANFDVLARTGLVGLGLWVALWLAWYWRLVAGCRRLLHLGLGVRRRVAVLCMMFTTAILVSVLFAPEVEGAQIGALLWTMFGIGVAMTGPVVMTGTGAGPRGGARYHRELTRSRSGRSADDRPIRMVNAPAGRTQPPAASS